MKLVNLIANRVLALLEHPDQMEKLRRNPAMIKPAVEELLRYGSPVFMSTERYAREEVNIHGVSIPRGGMTLGVIGSANRYETVFENANALDITPEPNKHLSFGQGIHFGVGAPLARLEVQIAINTLLRRMPELRVGVATDSLRWRPSIDFTGTGEAADSVSKSDSMTAPTCSLRLPRGCYCYEENRNSLLSGVTDKKGDGYRCGSSTVERE